MKIIVVTDVHKNRGEVLEVNHTGQSQFYSDEDGRMYHINDIVDVELMDHEQDKADRLAEYWTKVSMTIQEHHARYRP